MDCEQNYGLLQMKTLLIVALLSLTACTPRKAVTNTSSTAATSSSAATTPVQSPDAVISESDKLTDETIKDLLIKFRGVVAYSYNADLDYEDHYESDDGNRDYYFVKNYESFEQLKASVLSYTTEDIFNKSLYLASFEEKDGKLYLSKPAMGISSYSIKDLSWERIDETTVSVLGISSDEVVDGRKYIIHFGKEDGVWKVTSYEFIPALK